LSLRSNRWAQISERLRRIHYRLSKVTVTRHCNRQ
jgi:hypothetical protein